MPFNPQDIVFAVITQYPSWYRGKTRSASHTDKIRGNLALEFIQKALSFQYRVVVVDGYSSKSFRKELNNFQNLKILKRRSSKRSPAKRQAFKAASKLPSVKVIIATEPEKVSLIDSIRLITQSILENKADIVIPKREEQLFRTTYPDYMYESEVEGNNIYNKQLKLHNILSQDNENLDIFFGPIAFKNDPKILCLFTKVFRFRLEERAALAEYFDPEEYSNTQSFPIIMALKKKLMVQSVEIPFLYSKDQKLNETFGVKDFFIKKRQAQRLGALVVLMRLLNYLQNK